jgi:Na+/pantothenate symporter
LSLVSLATYVFTKVSVTVYAGALVFKTLLPDTFGSPDNAFWVGAFATVALTGVYTVLGGMRAVLYTDSAQAVVLLIGSAANCVTLVAVNACNSPQPLRRSKPKYVISTAVVLGLVAAIYVYFSFWI